MKTEHLLLLGLGAYLFLRGRGVSAGGILQRPGAPSASTYGLLQLPGQEGELAALTAGPTTQEGLIPGYPQVPDTTTEISGPGGTIVLPGTPTAGEISRLLGEGKTVITKGGFPVATPELRAAYGLGQAAPQLGTGQIGSPTSLLPGMQPLGIGTTPPAPIETVTESEKKVFAEGRVVGSRTTGGVTYDVVATGTGKAFLRRRA